MGDGEIRFTSDITVRRIQSMGGDHAVVAAARTSTSGEEALAYLDPAFAAEGAGLIDYLVRMRHGVPFEHSALTSYVHAPAMVWWEWIRHRVGMTVDCPELSFSLESGRYRQLRPVFWVPRRSRKLVPAPGHRSARPAFLEADDDTYRETVRAIERAAAVAWVEYEGMVRRGVANEVARSVLGFGIYYSGWVTCNPRSLMHFLSLRTHEPAATFVSFPQAEIEEAARAEEAMLAEGWPLTYRAFLKHGRVAP